MKTTIKWKIKRTKGERNEAKEEKTFWSHKKYLMTKKKFYNILIYKV